MIFGPVLSWELVTSSRRARYFAVRVIYGAILVATLWVHYQGTAGPRFGSAGGPSLAELAELATAFFRSFAVVQLLAVLVLTPAMVAGTLAEEKERRTIEYLLVTDLG